ncbi:MAG: hypothetical protein Q4C75_04475 [Bergeyella zoohelcum]|nr:hypothetical protein [Bergeyella zoohelcum]
MSKELEDAFKKLKSREVDTFPVKVISVDKEKGTCVVNDGELEYTDVQLSATVEDNGKRFFLFPKVGSFVLVSPINEDIHRLYVEFFSEIEELDFETEKSKIKINDEGFLLKKDNETLAKLMSDLLQEIQKMKFQTNTGSTIRLVNAPQFKEIENRFKTLLKEN